MAVTSLHSETAGATLPPRPANHWGFTKDMADAIAKQRIAEHSPFGCTGMKDLPQHFEEAAALLIVINRGLQLRAASPLPPGESEYDLLSPRIFATALEGIASLIHTGVLLQRFADD
jgi:hypothetical protein